MAIDLSHIDFSNGNYPYISPVPGQFPIVASAPYPGFRFSTYNDFKLLRECGFNVAFDNPYQWPHKDPGNKKEEFFPMKEKADKDFKNGADAGVRLMAYSFNFGGTNKNHLEGGKEFVDYVKNNGNLGGWDLSDEPNENQLKNVVKCWNYYLHQQTPDKMVYVNICIEYLKPEFPEKTAESNKNGESSENKTYLQTFQELLRPGLWCYDLYPIQYSNGKIVFGTTDYYKFFEIFRELARLSGRPFWAFCESTYFENNTLSRPRATEAFLRFEAFSALAYGAQGIVYWRYYPEGNTSGESYFSALTDKEGRKTPQWYAAQKVNSEISRFAHIFLDCEVLSCVHNGYPVINGISQKIEQGKSTFPPLISINYNRDGILLSHIRNQGHHYLLIVTHNPMIPQDVFIRFNANSIVEELTPTDIGNDDLAIATSESFPEREKLISQKNQIPIVACNRRIAAGGYLLFKWI